MADRLIIDHVPRSLDKLTWTDFSKSDCSLRLTMEMKNLTVVRVTKRHKKTAPAKLAIVNNDNALKHMIMEAFRHSIKSANIAIKSADDVKVTFSTKVRCKCQISGIVADGCGKNQRTVIVSIAVPLIFNQPLRRSEPD